MPKTHEMDVKVFMDLQKKQIQRQQRPKLNKNYAYVTPKEYAAMVSVHHYTVLLWLKNGVIEGQKMGRTWRIPVEKGAQQ